MNKNDRICLLIIALGLFIVSLFAINTYMNVPKNEPEQISATPFELMGRTEYISFFYLVDKVEPEIMMAKEPEPEPFYSLTDKERNVIECIVEGESGNQKIEGRVLVAQCIYNAMIQDNLTPTQVIKEYKYAGWSDTPSELTKEAVSAVFDRGEMGVEDNILWFCTIASSKKPRSFHATQKLVIEVGNHRFYKPLEA